MESRLFISPAFAQGAPAGGGMDAIIQFVPFILIFVIMWFLIIRPQQRRVRAHLEDSADVEVEIADNVKVKVARAMIAEVRSKSEPVKA
jgi:preprotein translocase subunit YajC